MNYLEVDYDTIQNTTMDSTEYFVVNDTLTVEDIYSVQEARSNDDQSCFSAVNFNCRSFGKKKCAYVDTYSTCINCALHIVIICRNKQYVWWCDTLGRPIYLLNIVFFSIPECGRWNLSNNLAAKLAGDAEDNFVTDEERWPSLAYLVHVRDKSTCTASIIGPRWVVASHSCITKRYV